MHPGSGWGELLRNLQALVPRLKARLAPERPFGLGLRLSNAESRELLAGDHLARFQDFLTQHDLYVFTLNGFPYGDLTGQPVKEAIFAPDWRAARRLDYTLRLVDILARLLPAGGEGGISTVPLSYRPWIGTEAEALAQITANLVDLTARLIRVEADTGKLIHLDLEPEPDGLLECSREVVEFFQTQLLERGAPQLARAAGLSEAEARRRLLRHLRVCLDTCHLAVAYEDPAAALAALTRNGIQVGKVQITAGLKVTLPANGAAGCPGPATGGFYPLALSAPGHRPGRRRPRPAFPGSLAGPGPAGPLPPGPVAHPLPYAAVCGALRGTNHHRGGDP